MKKVIPNSERWFSLESLEGEIWEPVVGFEENYEISTEGRVKRLAHDGFDKLGRHFYYEDRILRFYTSKSTGYPNVNLSKDGIHKTVNIHTLIADAFIPNPDNLPCINHIDEDRGNSVLSNLERCTYLYNNTYGAAKSKRRQTYLERHGRNTICQYSKKGELINEFLGGLAEIESKFKSIFKYIRQCLIGQKKSAGGYVWLYKDIPFNYNQRPYYRIPVCQYDLDGNLIHRYEGGLEEIKENPELNIDNIRGCVKGKSKTSQGYVWLHDGVPFTYKKPLPPNKGRQFEDIKPKTHQKWVIKLDENGNEIAKYKSVSEAARENGIEKHRFSRNINRDQIMTIEGMRFLVEKKEGGFIPIGHKGPRPDLKGRRATPVSKYNLDGTFVSDFDSIIEAAISIGKVHGGPDITNCCKGNLKTAFGYIWTYKGEKPPLPFTNNSIRKIEQFSLDGKYIQTFNSIQEAANIVGNGKAGSINNCLAQRSKTAFGYIWKYKTE